MTSVIVMTDAPQSPLTAPLFGPTGSPLTLVRPIEEVSPGAQVAGHVAGFPGQVITHTARYRCADGVEGWMGFDGNVKLWCFPYWTKTKSRG